MTVKNSPAAFPTAGYSELRPAGSMGPAGAMIEHNVPPKDGMTLRDYFAAQAITGAVAGGVVQQEELAEMARAAYALADEMLRAREI